MCGFAGYIALKDQFLSDEHLLRSMGSCINHRGPDGQKVWIDNQQKIALVFQRLSIIDLSDNAMQPMFDANKTVVITFNGEIYNYKKLRTELEVRGHHFKTQSDTEVFLCAFKEWGIACLDRLEGMFAAVLGNFLTNEWFFVRDRIGVKPLYFAVNDDYLSFGSEIKALWQLPWMQKTVNHQALYHYLTFLVTPAPYTLYKGVYKLPAGMYVKIDSKKELTFHEWYNPLVPAITYAQKDLANESFCISKIQELLTAAVEKRLISDVPYGVFLSGGIDSSLITALMSRYTDNVQTFNISFSDGPEYSESLWAKKVSKLFNTNHHELVISEKDAFDFFQKMVYHQDEPLADPVCIPLYYVSKLLKEQGVTVVQVGEGSDELYCGYQSYAQYINAYNRYYQPTQFLPQTVKKAGVWLAAKMFPAKKQYLSFLHQWAGNQHMFWTGAIAFSEKAKRDLLVSCDDHAYDPFIEKIYPGMRQQADSYAIVEYHLKKLYEKKPEADFLQSMIYLEFKQRLPELLLMRVDKMTMATSVEGRVPFLDHAHVEFAFQVSSSLKYKHGVTKYILKKACEGILPDDIIYRKKIGFSAPTTRWFKEGVYFKEYFLDLLATKKDSLEQLFEKKEVESILRHTQSASRNYTTQLWALQNVIQTGVLG